MPEKKPSYIQKDNLTGNQGIPPEFLQAFNDQSKRLKELEKKTKSAELIIDTLSKSHNDMLKTIYGDQTLNGNVGILVTIDQTKQQLEKTVKEANDSIRTDKATLISILGIFVSIFTLVIADINILKAVESALSTCGILLVSFGLILLFIMSLHHMAHYWLYPPKDNSAPKFPWKWLVISFFLIIIGVGLIFIDPVTKVKTRDTTTTASGSILSNMLSGQ